MPFGGIFRNIDQGKTSKPKPSSEIISKDRYNPEKGIDYTVDRFKKGTSAEDIVGFLSDMANDSSYKGSNLADDRNNALRNLVNFLTRHPERREEITKVIAPYYNQEVQGQFGVYTPPSVLDTAYGRAHPKKALGEQYIQISPQAKDYRYEKSEPKNEYFGMPVLFSGSEGQTAKPRTAYREDLAGQIKTLQDKGLTKDEAYKAVEQTIYNRPKHVNPKQAKQVWEQIINPQVNPAEETQYIIENILDPQAQAKVQQLYDTADAFQAYEEGRLRKKPLYGGLGLPSNMPKTAENIRAFADQKAQTAGQEETKLFYDLIKKYSNQQKSYEDIFGASGLQGQNLDPLTALVYSAVTHGGRFPDTTGSGGIDPTIAKLIAGA